MSKDMYSRKQIGDKKGILQEFKIINGLDELVGNGYNRIDVDVQLVRLSIADAIFHICRKHNIKDKRKPLQSVTDQYGKKQYIRPLLAMEVFRLARVILRERYKIEFVSKQEADKLSAPEEK